MKGIIDKNMTEEKVILNPFNTFDVEINKVVDENRKSNDWWKDYLGGNDPLVENEFYALFADGLLVKKGRSKFRSSAYLRGERMTKIKDYYEVL